MPIIVIETEIFASPETCFDMARDITLHCKTAGHTREKAVDGVVSGMFGWGESVTFEGVHFGVKQHFTARVMEFERPNFFVDEMTQGVFKMMRHRHEFIKRDDSTLMRDIIEWRAPLGVLGALADALFLKRYMKKFIARRGAILKQVAETQSLA